MAYQALYRKWRPSNFDEVRGQDHIVTTLKNQIEMNRIGHAYLFCGTRGTGKTSIAKIFAKAVNCEHPVNGSPCNECAMCRAVNEQRSMNVIEIDAASNNGVDNIREIREEVAYSPSEGKYKVYIIDEVHMLSIGAFNALLKTLEEPPSYVIFILATTEAHKIPITILSRCQRFDFKRINKNDITARLRKIVTEKGVMADDKSLNLIARVSDGAMRDSLSILDQAISMGNGAVEYSSVVSMLGLVTNEYLFTLTNNVIERNIEKCISTIEEIITSGKDAYLFIKDLIEHYRNLLMAKVTNNAEEVLDMSEENIALIKEQTARLRAEEIMRCIRILQEAEGNAKVSKQARLYLELSIIKMCKIEYDTSNEVILTRLNRLEENLKNGNIAVAVKEGVRAEADSMKKAATPASKATRPVNTESPAVGNASSKLTINEVQRAWKDVLERFKAKRAMIIYASILMGRPISCSNGIITVEFDEDYKLSADRLNKPDNKVVVNEVFSEVFQEKLNVQFVSKEKRNNEQNAEDVLMNAFGEGLVDILDE